MKKLLSTILLLIPSLVCAEDVWVKNRFIDVHVTSDTTGNATVNVNVIGESTLAVATGTSNGNFGVATSSPTAVLLFDQSQFAVTLPAGNTAYVTYIGATGSGGGGTNLNPTTATFNFGSQYSVVNATAIRSTNELSVGGSTLAVVGGKVGIGTTSPAQALDVVGQIQVSSGIRWADGTFSTTAVTAGGGSGDIEGVTAGVGLDGGGTSGTVTLDIDPSTVTMQGPIVSSITAGAFYSAGIVRTNLGLAIGTNVEAWDATLDDLASAPLGEADSVSVGAIAAGTLNANVVASSVAITSQYIGVAQLQDKSITAAKIANATITGTQVDASSFTMVGPTIETTEIQNGTLGSGIVASSVAITSQYIGVAQLQDKAITAGKIANATITGTQVDASSFTMVGPTVEATEIQAGTLGTGVIASSVAITSAYIGTAQLMSGSVSAVKMATADHGDVSWSAGVATVDNVAAANVAAGNLGGSVIASSITLASMYGAPTLTGTNITSLDDDQVLFDDENSNFTATTIGAAVEELDDVNGSGVNAADGKVDWTQLVSVPAGFADGSDDGGAGGGGFNTNPTTVTINLGGTYSVINATAVRSTAEFSVGVSTLAVLLGKVGIGVTNPSYMLSIATTAGTTSTLMAVSTGAVNIFAVQGTSISLEVPLVFGDGTTQTTAFTGGGAGDMVLASTQTISGGKLSTSFTNFIGSVTFSSSTLTSNISTATYSAGYFNFAAGSTVTIAGGLRDMRNSYGDMNYSVLKSSGSSGVYWDSDAYFDSIYATSATAVAGLGYAPSGLWFPVVAGSTYTFQFTMRHQCSSTGGIKYGMEFPALSTAAYSTFGNTSATAIGVSSGTAGVPILSIAMNTTASGTGYATIHGYVNVGTTGWVKLLFASTTGGQTSTLHPGSRVEAWKRRN